MPKAVPFRDPSESEPKRKLTAGKFAADDVAAFVSGALNVYASMRPLHLREAWKANPEDCADVAAPLARMLNKLPVKYAAKFNQLLDPIALITASYALLARGQAGEKILNDRFSEFTKGEAVPGTAKPTEADHNAAGRNGSSGQQPGTGTNREGLPFA